MSPPSGVEAKHIPTNSFTAFHWLHLSAHTDPLFLLSPMYSLTLHELNQLPGGRVTMQMPTSCQTKEPSPDLGPAFSPLPLN